MADTSVTASTPAESLAAQLWQKELALEVRRPGFWGQFMGMGPNQIIQTKDDLKKQKGDVINFSLVLNMSNAPIAADGWLEDNEESLTTHADSVKVDQIRNAVRLDGQLTEQRASADMRKTAKEALSDWYQTQFDTWIFKKLSGSTYQGYPGTAKGTPGSLTTVGEAATTNTNIIYGGDATSTGEVEESDTMTLNLLDRAKTCAITGMFGSSTKYKIRPVMVNGKKYFVVVLHPYQVYDLRNTDKWEQIQREANVRGGENPIFTGALGVYNGMILFEHDLIATASTWGTGSNVAGATALFLGAQAGLLARAQAGPNWNEQLFDYGNKWGVATGNIMGFDKATYNSIDFATVAIKTAAKNPEV